MNHTVYLNAFLVKTNYLEVQFNSAGDSWGDDLDRVLMCFMYTCT
jgi:hypothetical protein